MRPRRVVIVGASLAGLRAAQSLRQHGHDGPLTIIGAESHLPYDRPPLSKRALSAGDESEMAALAELAVPEDLDAEWLLGTEAGGLNLDESEVELAGGERIPFEGLVIATGSKPRTLPGLGPMEGVHVLRTIDDARRLRSELLRHPRVAVIGAGFIGLEVAATCREMGLEVTVVEMLATPLERVVGTDAGRAIAGRHREHGVSLELGVGVAGLRGGDRVEAVVLDDGRSVAAEVVVVGVGVSPATGWLAGSGLDLGDGVLCDPYLRALAGGHPLPSVVAAGDLARWHHNDYGQAVRVEHWTNAAEQGEAAGRVLLMGDEAGPYTPTPYFWSDQFGVKLQFMGRVMPGDQVELVDGDPAGVKWVMAYGREGRLVAVLGSARPALVMALGRQIAEGAPFPPPEPAG